MLKFYVIFQLSNSQKSLETKEGKVRPHRYQNKNIQTLHEICIQILGDLLLIILRSRFVKDMGFLQGAGVI